jgi:hypothetical protein
MDSSRRSRRAFRSNARRYLTADPDGRASVEAAARWLSRLPLTASLSDAQRRELVVVLRSESLVRFVPDDETQEIKLIQFDGAALSPLTILAGLAKL